MYPFWKNKRVLITGHSGFKGSWLSIWLNSLGADVTGFSLNPPTSENLYEKASVHSCTRSIIGDIRDYSKLSKVIIDNKPEIIFHLAAQPIVRKSYDNPVETYSTNVLGTVNLFEATRLSNTTKVIINVTSDKCYENNENLYWGFRETDPVGGSDPYSASKACAEIITNSYRKSFFNTSTSLQVSSARAGNVIGGGDWADGRLVPDLIKSINDKRSIILRYPHAIRPWQHVLDPLNGYLLLAKMMWESSDYSQSWNFGPTSENFVSVSDITEKIASIWGSSLTWKLETGNNPYEATILKLDCSKAILALGWKPKLSLDKCLQWTVDWYKKDLEGKNMQEITRNQINDFMEL